MSRRLELPRVNPLIREEQVGAEAIRLHLQVVGSLAVEAPSIAWVVPSVGEHARRDGVTGFLWGVGGDRHGAYMGEWALLRTQGEALEHARKLLVQWDAAARLGCTDGFPAWWTRPANDVRDQ